MLFSKWCHISGLLVVATGVISLAAGADVAKAEADEERSAVSLACDSVVDDELAFLSCQRGMPVNEQGFTPADLGIQAGEEDFRTEACEYYTGACTYSDGCSVARGEGWVYTECGSYIYAWMLICDGEYVGYGSWPCCYDSWPC